MKRPKGGSTIKQVAYARKLFNGDGKSKKDIARSVGYSPAIANNALAKIENTEGFHNAMEKLAVESNNIMLAVFEEYKARGLTKFSNKDLNGALNAIASAWERIARVRNPDKNLDPEQNPLRKVFMQKVQNQTINVTPIPKEDDPVPSSINIVSEPIVDLGF